MCELLMSKEKTLMKRIQKSERGALRLHDNSVRQRPHMFKSAHFGQVFSKTKKLFIL